MARNSYHRYGLWPHRSLRSQKNKLRHQISHAHSHWLPCGLRTHLACEGENTILRLIWCFASSSMASLPFSTLCLFQKPNSLAVGFVASNQLRLSTYSTVGFRTTKRSRKVGITVCRAASVVFRDLDADDFRHPLDQQVWIWSRRFLSIRWFRDQTRWLTHCVSAR